jgi:hypothetical protein
VAGVIGWKIYDALYEEQKKKNRPGLPPKWSHAGFLEQLVYDFILPGQTKKHVDLLRETDDASLAKSVRSTRSFSLYGQARVRAPEELIW